MKRILILNGPRLDLLGTRDPAVYGSTTLAGIEALVKQACEQAGVAPVFVQSASEKVLIESVQTGSPDGIIINPAAFTHFSFALADALRRASVPIVEVHLSNIFAREPYRRLSVISPVAHGVICGLGAEGYRCAVTAVLRMLSQS